MRYTRYTRYCVAEHLIYEETVDWNEIISSQQQQYKPGQGRVEVLVHHLIQSGAQELRVVRGVLSHSSVCLHPIQHYSYLGHMSYCKHPDASDSY